MTGVRQTKFAVGDVVREMWRANCKDGYGTPIPVRVSLFAGIAALVFLFGDSLTDLIGGSVCVALLFGILIVGLVADYREARERLERKDAQFPPGEDGEAFRAHGDHDGTPRKDCMYCEDPRSS